MKLSTVPLRALTAGVALAAACGLAACGTTTGTASPAPAPATVTVTASSDAPATSARPTSSASTSADSSSSRPSRPSTADAPAPDEPADATVDVGTVDATTAVWLDTACTDLGTLLPALFAVPTLDEATTPVEQFRAAYRDYYANIADTALQINANLGQIDPPAVEGGQALHDGYQYFISRLADITGSGAIAIDSAADNAGIKAAVDQIQFEVESLSQEDIGLNSFSSPELQEYMKQVPSCAELA